jgi:hypothetical protein
VSVRDLKWIPCVSHRLMGYASHDALRSLMTMRWDDQIQVTGEEWAGAGVKRGDAVAG